MPDGSKVDKYTLRNGRQMEVSILSYGGIVQSILVPDRNGKLADVVLGFDNLEGYIEPNLISARSSAATVTGSL